MYLINAPAEATMKIPKLPCILFFVVCITLFITYSKWYPNTPLDLNSLTSDFILGDGEERTSFNHAISYGIMFDAGSTGTRLHVYKFSQPPNGTPVLDHETFISIKPGLSAYADDPDKSAAGINELLDIAKKDIPKNLWASTPLVLKATAGLRLLPGEKAQKLLDKVEELFHSSPFHVVNNSVSIMKGTDEGIFAWITVNFLTGSLTDEEKKHSGILDLGGGSTQITFYPYVKDTFTSAPAGYITNFQLFNTSHYLYSHSYLGLGLMSARLEIMGGKEGEPLGNGEQLVSPCLTPDFVTTFNHAAIDYTVKGFVSKGSLYESCFKRVSKILSGRVHKSKEVAQQFFYVFSYYFDRAVDTKLIDPVLGGTIKVKDFEIAARKECKSIEKTSGDNPFLCMDLTYITQLLQELGFPKEKDLKLVNKINSVETSWALGATFYYMNKMN
ncbi:ectonucleoside triphosphate diphosphohydrolase 6 isoform X2 [Bombina bombina]|uniref:ectonucleoside triphosphate diphosphohydrolase 6 isoform X2 n=1 Tax=Bombina bombina TaxID=8345 RepID=UPI00235A77F4|nr:ectonucleoside triphosphate diphosphohydrolase 6 isoform X2 [Bombina bombina]